MNKEYFMKEALALAKISERLGEVPVGAVVVRGDEIVGRGYNSRETSKNALAHAEIIAINDACKNLDGWRLWECDMYVTLQPCPMCAGAIMNARIKNVYFGATDKSQGYYKPRITGGILEDECQEILSNFFSKLRK